MRFLFSSIIFLIEAVPAFQPTTFGRHKLGSLVSTAWPQLKHLNLQQDGSENPEDFYPDLEFIDYSDPNYVIDQGMGDQFFRSGHNDGGDNDDTEAQIEAMREDRRRRNDEFQFETYFEKILKSGDEYFGEWTVYKTSTFLDGVADEEAGHPRLVRARHPIKVKSRAFKIKVETESEFRVDGERICHEELLVVADDAKDTSTDVSAYQISARCCCGTL